MQKIGVGEVLGAIYHEHDAQEDAQILWNAVTMATLGEMSSALFAWKAKPSLIGSVEGSTPHATIISRTNPGRGSASQTTQRFVFAFVAEELGWRVVQRVGARRLVAKAEIFAAIVSAGPPTIATMAFINFRRTTPVRRRD